MLSNIFSNGIYNSATGPKLAKIERSQHDPASLDLCSKFHLFRDKIVNLLKHILIGRWIRRVFRIKWVFRVTQVLSRKWVHGGEMGLWGEIGSRGQMRAQGKMGTWDEIGPWI